MDERHVAARTTFIVATLGCFPFAATAAPAGAAVVARAEAVDVAGPGMPPVLARTAGATPVTDLEVAGHLGGYGSGLALDGRHAFKGLGPRLVVIDVADPARPTPVGQSAVFEGIVRGAALADGIAYVAASESGLHVLDARDAARPVEVAHVRTAGAALAVSVAGGYAYVAESPSLLEVVDVRDPARPAVVAAVALPDDARDVSVVGSTVYVAAAEAGLVVLDVRDPAAPIELSSLYLAPEPPGATADAVALHVSGDLAYVAAATGGLRVVDVSDPADPREIGHLMVPGAVSPTTDVWVDGSLAYIAAGELAAVDVADPAAPRLVGESEIPALEVAVHDVTAYAATESVLSVADVSQPVGPTVLGTYEGDSDVVANVEVAGTYTHLASLTRLEILDTSDPSRPRPVGAWPVPEDLPAGAVLHDVAVVADHVYAVLAWEDDASSGWALVVLDVSDPAQPVEAARIVQPGLGWHLRLQLDVAAGYAYLALGDSGLRIVDVRDPLAPRLVDAGAPAGAAFGVDVVGSLAFVAGGSLRIVDVSHPANPAAVGECGLLVDARDIVVSGNHAYVSGRHAVSIVDVRDPGAPAVVASYTPPAAFVLGLDVAGSHGYVTTERPTGLRVLDVAVPAEPREIAWHGTADVPTDVRVSGTRAYLAGGWVALEIVDVSSTGGPKSAGRASAGPGGAKTVRAGGDRTYMSRQAYVGAIDAADPERPIFHGWSDVDPESDRPSTVTRIDTEGEHVYVAANAGQAGSLQVWDFQDPAAPVHLAAVRLSGTADDVDVDGPLAYVAGDNGLSIVDVSRPLTPALLATVDTLEDARAVAASGGFAYVAARTSLGSGVLAVVDAVTPVEAHVVGEMRFAGRPDDIALVDGIAYIAATSGSAAGELRVADVRDPTAPREVGAATVADNAWSVAVVGAMAYVAAGGGVQVLDVSDPTGPRASGSFRAAARVLDVDTDGELVYAAAGEAGLYFLRPHVRERWLAWLPIAHAAGH